MMKMNKLGFLVLLAIFGCKKKVEQTTVLSGTITESAYASGIVKSKNQYQVYATASGTIKKILVQEGDLVKIGDPIMLITNTTAQLNTDNARLAADYSSVRENADKLSEISLNINLARTKLTIDSSLYERQRGLWEQNIGSQVEFEQRELAYKNSKTTFQSLQLRYKELERQLRFAEKQSRKNLEISQTITGDYVVKSIASGRVYSLLKEVGEMISPQIPVAVIGSATDFFLELQIDEYDIARVKPSQRVFVRMDSYADQVFEAEVLRIDPIMNERTRTFLVEAVFTKAPPVLYPNLSAETNILIRSQEKALIIPRNYLVRDSFVLDAQNQERRVVIGLKDLQKVQIINGLSADETILKPKI
jgi:HlyD family secretion protein